MAGFQLTLYGRIWVTPKVNVGRDATRADQHGQNGHALSIFAQYVIGVQRQ